MKKLRKISFLFTVFFILFAVFSPNLIGQQNKAQAYCLSSGYGGCLAGWSTTATLFCGGISFLLNGNIPICITTSTGGAGSGNDFGTVPGLGITCLNADLGLNPATNFLICESIALSLVSIRCTNDHLIPCVCTEPPKKPDGINQIMCSGDDTGLPNKFWDKDIPWARVGNYSSNCTLGKKCEYTKREYKYQDAGTGDLSQFSGQEEIFVEEENITTEE